jgi:molybdopterin-guanine dinucleotide biosynthesis protein A
MWSHTVAILIGGQSVRMGTPKHEVMLPNGLTMLDMMLEFANATAENVVLVGGSLRGYQSVMDLRHQEGPVAGIETLLHSNIDSQYLIVGCDMPNLQTIDVQPLLECSSNAAFSFGERILGLPLKISQEMASTCTAYLDSGHRSMSGLVEQGPHRAIKIDPKQHRSMTSLNSPADVRFFQFQQPPL